MRCHPVLVFAVLAFTLPAAGPNASAAPRRLGSTNLATRAFHKRYLPGTDASQAVCRLGQFGDPVGTIGDEFSGGTIYFGEGDTYWTYLELRPESCAGCGSGKLGTLSAAHLALYFPFAPETVTVSVSVVGNVPVACHYPNYFDPGAIICAPFTATFDCQDPLTTVDFAIPIPPGCILRTPPGGDGAGFLGFEFVSASDTTTFHQPLLAVQAAARTCNSFNQVGSIPFDMVLEYLTGNPVMYAEVSQCVSTIGVPPREAREAALELSSGAPNPFSGRVACALAQPRAGDVEVAVYDVRGARVRTLHRGFFAAGVHAVDWNGRDESGAHAPAGVYFVRAYSHAGSCVRRVLRMP